MRLYMDLLLLIIVGLLVVKLIGGEIPTTLEGPFKPVSVPLDDSFRGHAVDLPDTDDRLQRIVHGFEPEQISVSLSSTYDSVWISWVTGDFQIGENIKPLDPKSVASVVHYGMLSFFLTKGAKGHSLIYNQLYPFEGLKNYTSGIIHHVKLTGLRPQTKYYYQCGDPSIGAMSKVLSFVSMPVSGPKSYPNRIAVVGDLGLTYNSTSTVEHMKTNIPDLLLLVGDVSYANLYLTNGTGSDCYSCSFPDTPIHETYQPRWDYWGRYMQPLISKVPIMVVEGNHEIEQQAGNLTFAAYSSRFAFPSQESKSASTLYYSFNAGGIHFLMLGSYTPYHKSAAQYKWLVRDLAKVDRKETPWLIAIWHAPWYSSYNPHYREAECMKVAMEELLYKSGVDIVFNGHVHAYERSNRLYNYTLDPCGPVYITVGDGGNREKMAIKHADEPGNCPEPSETPDAFMGGFCAYNFTSGPAAGKFCWDRQPEYSAYRESSFGHGILEVKNETYALWTWHRNQDMYDEAGDQIYIVRQPDRCPVEVEQKGTASVVLAGLIASLKLLGGTLADHTFLFLGAGEAGTGIAELIALEISKKTHTPVEENRKNIWLVDSKGLIVSSRKESLQHFKQPWAHEHEPVKGLLDTVKGRAIFASGSPFDPVEYNGKLYVPGQANNAYIFPGFGLGIIMSGTIRVHDDLLLAASSNPQVHSSRHCRN